MSRIKWCVLLLAGFGFSALAWGLASPFPSCVAGINIPNTHVLDEDGLILRGMAPRNMTDIEDLKMRGIDKILIFKNQVRGEVAKEVDKLLTAGWQRNQVVEIPFKWKEHGSFKEACTQTIEAMALIQKQQKRHKPIFFHCTVGEDRTGYLAGLLRWWWQEASVKQIFEKEMCWNGYGAGNPRKPYKQVVKKIRDSLTPLYVKMTYVLARAKQLKVKALCGQDPATLEDFRQNWAPRFAKLRCQESPRYLLKDDAEASCSL